MKVLQIIETGYRATIEEQDDPVVWITHAMKGAGADLDVLLLGNAVNYAVTAQDSSGLSFGDWKQTEPPRLAHDISSLTEKGASVFALKEDLCDRGLDSVALAEGVQDVSRSAIAEMMGQYDQVWHW